MTLRNVLAGKLNGMVWYAGTVRNVLQKTNGYCGGFLWLLNLTSIPGSSNLLPANNSSHEQESLTGQPIQEAKFFCRIMALNSSVPTVRAISSSVRGGDFTASKSFLGMRLALGFLLSIKLKQTGPGGAGPVCSPSKELERPYYREGSLYSRD